MKLTSRWTSGWTSRRGIHSGYRAPFIPKRPWSTITTMNSTSSAHLHVHLDMQSIMVIVLGFSWSSCASLNMISRNEIVIAVCSWPLWRKPLGQSLDIANNTSCCASCMTWACGHPWEVEKLQPKDVFHWHWHRKHQPSHLITGVFDICSWPSRSGHPTNCDRSLVVPSIHLLKIAFKEGVFRRASMVHGKAAIGPDKARHSRVDLHLRSSFLCVLSIGR